MKICTDCKWYENGFCKSPRKFYEGVSLVTGEHGQARKGLTVDSCEEQRGGALTGWIGCRVHNLCGQEARWFTPKDDSK